jgi:hypothetical protein
MSQWIKGRPIDEALCIKINSTILNLYYANILLKKCFLKPNTRPFVLRRLKDVSFSFKEPKIEKENLLNCSKIFYSSTLNP